MVRFVTVLLVLWICHISGISVRGANIDDTPSYQSRRQIGLPPRFEQEDNQEEEYGWPGQARNLTCRVQAGPIVFVEWRHNQRQLENDETFRIYSSGYGSTLQISVSEINTDWIYGEYTCRAVNGFGKNELPFFFIRAEVPDKPESITVHDVTPDTVILSVVPPSNDGGKPLSGYRVEYDTQSQDFLLHEQIRIEHLRPSTSYIFYIHAINEVGTGNPSEIYLTTRDISQPYPLKIFSDPLGQYPHRYTLQWERPETGGLPIKEYLFYYRKVEVGDDLQVVEVIEEWIRRIKEDDPSSSMQYYLLEGLESDQPYQVEIRARNDIGWSSPNSEFVFVTSQYKTVLKRSEKCVRLLETLQDAQYYLEQVIYHIVNETTILDGRIPSIFLFVLKTMTPEQAIFSAVFEFADNVEVVKQMISDEVCRIADSKSIQELADGPIPHNLIPLPSERKALFGYLLLQSRVIKERLYEFTDTMVDSGYPKFPLQVDKEAATIALNKYFDALFEVINGYGKLAEKYALDELEGLAEELETQYTMYVTMESQYLEYLLDAQNVEDLLQKYQDSIGGDQYPITLDGNMIAVLTDLFFDVVNNRELYYQFFDVLESVIFTITEMGLLDLPVA